MYQNSWADGKWDFTISGAKIILASELLGEMLQLKDLFSVLCFNMSQTLRQRDIRFSSTFITLSSTLLTSAVLTFNSAFSLTLDNY